VKQDVVKIATLEDMKALRAIAHGCEMKIASAAFEEYEGIPRLKRFSLVDWGFDKPDTRTIILNVSDCSDS